LKGLRPGAILPYLRQLDMVKYLNTKVRNLSGGNRRKVSLALAMVGKPNCLVLDEPSTGVDPASRRLLWDVLKAQPQAILLSTHVMEEAEALATKIIIQMRGRIQVVGSVEDLIYRFCKHLTLSFRSPLAGVAEEVCEKIGGESCVKDQQGSLVEIEIPLQSHDMAEVMADLFTMMESHKQKWQIDQYSIAQATLNTVFLDLARRPVRVPRWHKKTTTCLSLPTQQWTKDRMGTKSLDKPGGSLLPTPRSSFKPSANNSRKSSAVVEDEKTKYFASEKK
jgi:ABC-type multidrug transport system ATPase subunit